jgi:hypothetical protein
LSQEKAGFLAEFRPPAQKKQKNADTERIGAGDEPEMLNFGAWKHSKLRASISSFCS